MERVKKKILLLSILVCCLSSVVIAQSVSERATLSVILENVAAKFKVKLSYSPIITDIEFPQNTDISGDDVEIVLKRVLLGTTCNFRKVHHGNFYIFKDKNLERIPEPQEKLEIPKYVNEYKDTIRMVDSLTPAFVSLTFNQLPNSNVIFPSHFNHIKKLTSFHQASVILPTLAVKSNLLYNSTGSMNLGLEWSLARNWTMDLSGNYNPWTFSNNRKFKHLMIQPEIRWWPCLRFIRHFVGLHVHYSLFNVGGMLPWGFKNGKMFGAIKNDNILNHRYQGWLVGAGVGYGYHLILANRWSLESEIGFGYAFISYDKFSCEKCGEKFKSTHRNYFGPTKAAITLVYMIK